MGSKNWANKERKCKKYVAENVFDRAKIVSCMNSIKSVRWKKRTLLRAVKGGVPLMSLNSVRYSEEVRSALLDQGKEGWRWITGLVARSLRILVERPNSTVIEMMVVRKQGTTKSGRRV